MSMSKQDFIALADAIREHNQIARARANNGDDSMPVFTDGRDGHLDTLADFCKGQNPNFLRERWFGYIAGENGKNGGRIR